MSVDRKGSTVSRVNLLTVATIGQQAETYRRSEIKRQEAYCRRISTKIANRLAVMVADGKLGKNQLLEELLTIGRQTARGYGVASGLCGICVEQAGLALVQKGLVAL